MAAKLTRLTHKIAIQLHLVAESCFQFSLQAAISETFGYTLVSTQAILKYKHYMRIYNEMCDCRYI
jgi:hypothetical protein